MKPPASPDGIHLDFIPSTAYIPTTLLAEGRLLETILKAERRKAPVPEMRHEAFRTRPGNRLLVGAAPAGGFVPRAREAPGPDRGALSPLRREPAGLGTGRKASSQETRTRGAEIATKLARTAQACPGGAPSGARVPRERGAAKLKKVAPLGAPSPRHFVGGRLPRPLAEGNDSKPRHGGAS